MRKREKSMEMEAGAATTTYLAVVVISTEEFGNVSLWFWYLVNLREAIFFCVTITRCISRYGVVN